MQNITLTTDEADEILYILDSMNLSKFRHNRLLMDAVNKLNRTYNYPASCSAGIPEVPEELWVIKAWNKIDLIKAFRTITMLGLKDAKDYIDNTSKEVNGELVVYMHPHQSNLAFVEALNAVKFSNVRFGKV